MEKNIKLDYKKKYKDLYQPKTTGMLIDIAAIPFLMVDGKGNPNEEDGDYSKAMQLLYGITFTIKMSRKGTKALEGYHDYVVPPLEGLWWQEGQSRVDYAHKETFSWIAMIRLPEFVTKQEFGWAVAEAAAKKKLDLSKVEYFTYDEGLCVQCMHLGNYDTEPATLNAMEQFAAERHYKIDCTSARLHHEIYLSDPRRTAPEKCKTVIREPVCKVE